MTARMCGQTFQVYLKWSDRDPGEMALTTISPNVSNIFVVHAKVIFLDQFLRPPGSHPGAPVRRCSSLAIRTCGIEQRPSKGGRCERKQVRLTLSALAGGGAVTTDQPSLGLVGLDKLVSRINAGHESVSPGQSRFVGITPGIRSDPCREIQLKSLILAQPERWRRG